MTPLQMPKSNVHKTPVVEETPVHNEVELVEVAAREALELSQASQQDLENSTKGSTIRLMRNAASGVSPEPTKVPRAFAAFSDLPTCEAVDSQGSTIRHAETLLRSAGPFVPSSSLDDLVTAEDELEVVDTITAAVNKIDDTEDLQPSASDPVESTTTTPVDEIDDAEDVEKSAIDTVFSNKTTSVTIIEDAVDVVKDMESLPNAKRRKKGNKTVREVQAGEAIGDSATEDGRTHAKPIKGAWKKKLNGLSNVGPDQSQESIKSTTVIQIKSPDQHLDYGHITLGELWQSSPEGAPEGSSSSFHQTRSSAKGASPTIHGATSHEIKVLFGSTTEVDTMDAFRKRLRKAGLRMVSSVDDCDYLCVGKGELRKTSNVISAIAFGKPIVTEEWAKESATQGKLLDPTPFLASHPRHKKEWGITLAEAIDRGKLGLKPFADYMVHITPALKQQLGSTFQEIKQIAELGGATKVLARLPTGKDQGPTILVIATEEDPKLEQLTQDGWRCYSKDMITISVLRSALDLESDEFLIGVNADIAGGGRGSRGQKRKR